MSLPISKLTNGQKYALDTMLSGANVFLTGEAGTGKSEVIKKFMKDIEKSQEKVKELKFEM